MFLDASDFLLDGSSCAFGYVFNLDNDTLELYRGYFPNPQGEEEKEINRIQSLFGKDGNRQFFTHLVGEVNRNNIECAQEMMRKWSLLKTYIKFKDKHYPEKELLSLQNDVLIANKLKKKKWLKIFTR